jgi:flavin-dependent dehydrogenase
MLGSPPMSLNEAACRRWDVLIVGAGLAGPVAAQGLARRGCSVLLVDRAAFPRWKVCGACLNPYTLSILARQGLADLPDQYGALPIRQMRLAVRGRQAAITLPGWKTLSRARLDNALVDAAVRTGAVFLDQTQAALGPVLPDGRTVLLRQKQAEATTTARVILAADGLGGRLLAGEEAAEVTPGSRIGAGVLADDAPGFYQDGIIYMAYGRPGYVGLVRQEDGRLNIAAALNVGHVRAAHNPGAATAELMREVGWPAVPDLADLPWRGTPPLTRRAAKPACDRVLAIGDAAGYIEPFTGEGMGWAVASGAAVVPLAAQDWQPARADEWTALHRRKAIRRERLCRAVTWVSRHPSVARALVSIVSYLPWLATPFVRTVRA